MTDVTRSGFLAPCFIRDLRAGLRDPACKPDEFEEWMNSPEGIGAACDLATSSGRGFVNKQPEHAVECWESFRHRYSRLQDTLVLSEQPIGPDPGVSSLTSWLRLHQELAAVYQQIPALDPDGKKLDSMIRDLFEGKWKFIQKRDWQATEVFHLSLAIIFLRRGILGTEQNAASAIYQLKAALDDADKRERAEGFYQPLADVRAHLAEAYQKTGNVQRASSAFQAAALAYLDEDALQSAQSMIRLAGHISTAGEDFTALQRILRLRQTGIPNAAAISTQQAPWLYQSTSAISSEFLARQRFKLVADRVLATSTSADEATLLQAALETFQVLTKDKPKLVGVRRSTLGPERTNSTCSRERFAAG